MTDQALWATLAPVMVEDQAWINMVVCTYHHHLLALHSLPGKGVNGVTHQCHLSSSSASPLSPVSPALFFFRVHLAIQHLLWLHVNFWQADSYPLYHRGSPIIFISSGKISACNTGDLGLILGLGISPGEENGYPSYSYLENSMDRGVWWATLCGVTKSQTQLSN